MKCRSSEQVRSAEKEPLWDARNLLRLAVQIGREVGHDNSFYFFNRVKRDCDQSPLRYQVQHEETKSAFSTPRPMPVASPFFTF